VKADRLLTETATGPGGKWCPDDVGGVVEAVDTGVTPFKPGDEVFDMLPRA
jgi:NADPH:quinone reductase-like Zn-dependent oxidoreductase